VCLLSGGVSTLVFFFFFWNRCVFVLSVRSFWLVENGCVGVWVPGGWGVVCVGWGGVFRGFWLLGGW
jgi:hypothetical protein